MPQLPMFQPRSDWRAPRMIDLPERWPDATRVGFDLETRDPHLHELGPGYIRRDGYVVGYSFALEDGPAHYLPLRHQGGDNVEEMEGALRYLRDRLASYRGEIVGANLQYEIGWAQTDGLAFHRDARMRDVQVADPLIDELQDKASGGTGYSLDAIAARWGEPPKDEALLEEAARYYGLDPKADLWRLPARFVGPYAEQDARLPLSILRRQESEIDRQDLWQVWNLETDLLPVLMRMKLRGVLIDQDRLAQVEEWSLAEEASALAAVRDLTGVDIPVGKASSSVLCAPALEHVGVSVKRGTTKTGLPTASVDKFLLERLERTSPDGSAAKRLADRLIWARKMNKLRGTFAASVREHMVGGRIHTTFTQVRGNWRDDDDQEGTGWGRLSSVKPNLQQQPSRDDAYAPRWRSIYIPEPGTQWAALDYKAQEPRLVVHYAALLGLQGAEEMAQRYRLDPKTCSHTLMAQITGQKRSDAKSVSLAIQYGQGGKSFAQKQFLPTRWAVNTTRWDDRRFFATRDEAEAWAEQHRSELRTFMGRAVWEVAGEQAQAMIDTFNAKLPFVRALSQACQESVRQHGNIRTLLGRVCHFPKRSDGSYDWLHKALNRLAQGGAADQMKRALILLDRADRYLQLQVHDEADGSVSGEPEARAMSDIMAHAVELIFPSHVDIDLGRSWGEARPI